MMNRKISQVIACGVLLMCGLVGLASRQEEGATRETAGETPRLPVEPEEDNVALEGRQEDTAEKEWREAIEAYREESIESLSFVHSLLKTNKALGDSSQTTGDLMDLIEILGPQEPVSRSLGEAEHRSRERFASLNERVIKMLMIMRRFDEAHDSVERFRAQDFLAMLAERDLVFSEVPAELEQRRRELAVEYDAVIEAREQLDAEGQRAQALAVRRRQKEIHRQRQRLDAEIRGRSPRLAELRDPEPLKVDEIRQALEPGTLMLSYLVGPEETFLFTISRGNAVEAHSLEIDREELWRQIGRYFGQLREAGSSGLAASRLEMGKWLYEKLVEPAAALIEGSERLLIVAEGPLHYLPFAALVRPLDDDRKWQYLVEWKPVHSALSATVYAQLQTWRPEPGQGAVDLEITTFGDPAYPSDGSPHRGRALVRSAIRRGLLDALTPLPYTRYEVTEIERLFSSKSARTFLGEDATEENAKALGKNVRIVHFAVHGVNDPANQLDSFIALSILDDHGDNGLLQAWEIYERIRLDADLVVLSACQTAFGPEADGEGLMSLSRAFQYAGARTVMASLWSVSDASTAELMIRFYRYLLDGQAKDEALRAAQIEFIRGPVKIEDNGRVVEKDYSSPYHWAAFQVIGDWQ